MVERVLHWTLQTILRWPLIFWFCFVANLVGVVFGGVFWYGPLLLDSPWWAWPFIPDCPLAALLGSVALLGVRANRPWWFFYALVAFAGMKYGAWTVAFWLRFWSTWGAVDILSLVLFVTHIGLFIEGLLFVPYAYPLSLAGRVLVIGVFALSVGVDYGLGYHPPLGGYVTVEFAFWLAAVLTLLCGVGLLLLPRRVARLPLV